VLFHCVFSLKNTLTYLLVGVGFPLVEGRWASFSEMSESGGQSLKEMVDDLRVFQASQGQLMSWLAQKDKMVSFLGSLATEPGMVGSQIQQVEVSSEFDPSIS